MEGTTDIAQELEHKHYLQVFKRYPITLVKGGGARVTDSEGREYIDALAGIAVNSVGHCHPNVVAAIQRQAERLIHISNFYYNEPQSRLAERLTALSGLERAFFCNSGVEAVEGAIKLVRRYAAKRNRHGTIIRLEGCFHGRTLATLTMGKRKYQDGFSPLPDGFAPIPFDDLEAFRNAADDQVGAVIIEPVQGEGGIRPVGRDFLQGVARICKERDILLVLDEIQCGMGRTGKMFAYEHYGVKPDVLTLAKALGGGFPIGALLASENAASAFDYGSHGTTFGGNPLACAAALATVDTLAGENLPQAALAKGEALMSKIRESAQEWDAIKEVRGMGLMIGVELAFKGADVVKVMLEMGVLANCTEDTIIRLVPPLNISEEDLETVHRVLVEAVKKVESQQ